MLDVKGWGLFVKRNGTSFVGDSFTLAANSGEDITLKMSDNAGVRGISFTDSGDVQVAQLNSDGDFSLDGTITGLSIETTAGALFNSDGGSNDIQMKGNTEDNLFFLDSSTDRIGILRNDPGLAFDVSGGGRFLQNINISSGSATEGGQLNLAWPNRENIGAQAGTWYIDVIGDTNDADLRITSVDSTTTVANWMRFNFGDDRINSLKDFNAQAEFYGSCESYAAGENVAITEAAMPYYLKVANNVPMSANIGWPMFHAGSIKSVGVTFTTTIHNSNGNVIIRVMVNGSNVFSATVAVNATGNYEVDLTQARGTDVVAQGDIVALNINSGAGYSGTLNDICASCEVQFDT
jgi:hypothetical protein